jgi:hypothetical protein
VTSSESEPYRLQVGSIEQETMVLHTIITSEYYISSPGIIEGHGGNWNAIWNIWDGVGGDLEMSSNSDQVLSDKWSEPLRLTSDEDLEMDPAIFKNDLGTYTLGMIPITHLSDNGSMNSPQVFTEQNLSWGADAVSLDLDPGPGSSPGTLIRASVLVEYRGMTPYGRVRVDIYRILKDKDTGGQTLELWDSDMVEFSAIGQTAQVEFTVPVKEFQYGLVAVTGPAITGIPAHSTQRFSSLPAIPDLEILTMDVASTSPQSSSASIEVSVKNWGTVSSGQRELVIGSSRPTAPLLFENGSYEPLFLRERDVHAELNSSQFDIPAGATIEVVMNISLSPGMNGVWSVVKGPNWLPNPESQDYLVIPSFPHLELSVDRPWQAKDKNESIDVKVVIENTGSWPVNVSYLDPGPVLVKGLRENLPSYSAYINGIFLDKVPIFSERKNISGLGPGENIYLNWTLPDPGIIGEVEVMVGLSDGTNFISDGIDDDWRGFNIIITSKPELDLVSISQSMVGLSYDSSLKVQFFNPTGYMIDVVHITLYNGFPSDDVIISEAIVVEVGPGQYGEITLYFPLEEGQYILTTTAEASVVTGDGRNMGWLEMARLESDIKIHKTGLPEQSEDDTVDMDEVTTAGIITISSVMLVLLVASFFYQKETEKEDEEKD